jgi:hypothetical protein
MEKIFYTFFVIILLAIIAIACGEGEWEVIIYTPNASEADLALWETFERTDYMIELFRYHYQIHESFWRDFGYNSPHDINFPFAKTLNSDYLLTNGLRDDPDQWHKTEDYVDAGRAIASSTHYQIYYKVSMEDDWLAYANPRDRITKLGIRLFLGDEQCNNPATRAGDFIHEGWHHWQYLNNYETSHEECPEDRCEITGPACDWYYEHTPEDYADKPMTHTQIANGKLLFHSPNQVQVEFLCDLFLFHCDFVPTIVKDLAKSEANQRIDTRFVNAVPFRCGIPEPFENAEF